MPLFESILTIERKDGDGHSIHLPPKEALEFIGPTLKVVVSPSREYQAQLKELGEPVPDPIPGMALIDTGASTTSVDENVCVRLGLKQTGVAKLCHAGGVTENRPRYAVQLLFPETPLNPVLCPVAISVCLATGNQPHIVLVGRDILSPLKFTYNGPRGRIEIDS